MSVLTKDELIAQTKASIREITADELNTALNGDTKPVVIDVREADEVATGKLADATHIPRGFLELKVEKLEKNREAPIVIYCAGGVRSALAARSLVEMGYSNVTSLKGGFGAWKNGGFAWGVEQMLTQDQQIRYGRHLTLDEVGSKGQLDLLNAKVLLVGAGGLGSPAAFYLAAAGVGTIGIVDPDVVDRSNLQRQILHRDADVGVDKVESAKRAMTELNPDVNVVTYKEFLTSDNVFDILDDGGYTIVADGCDNFPTRYLINDACVMRGLPNVHGSIFRFEGQVSVFAPTLGGPCYRCLYPEPPPPGMAPSCAEAGVIGALPGIVGTMQAIEVIKLILGKGRSLAGRLLQYDAMEQSWRELKLRRDPECPVCSESPSITELIDYEAFCSVGG